MKKGQIQLPLLSMKERNLTTSDLGILSVQMNSVQEDRTENKRNRSKWERMLYKVILIRKDTATQLPNNKADKQGCHL